ncbi:MULTISPECIES: flavin reductase family protein [Streptomyces]|uniref:Flavin reductase family protein n=1 Tax=Streptomyces lonegramiae TaxID=3075524 RepID=A0ABU2XK26_9ACTN|nr:flavin reductase family protein [Streptomyces sp. DSM 41529]MDT0546273.1 flavin reductase family protein [Streptomyces sp. DSM 41529]
MAATAVRYLRSVGSPTTAARPDAPLSRAAPAPPRPGRPALRAVRADERLPLDPAEFRRVLGHFASGVTVVAAVDEEGPAGFACQSFSSLSLDPPLIAFMVARTSTTWPRIARAGVFCVNILGAGQGELCRGFAVSGSRRPDKFAGVEHRPAPVTGSPRLVDVPAWIDCTVHAVHTGGDHLVVVGRVRALGTDDAAARSGPLLFHRGAFASLAPLDPDA